MLFVKAQKYDTFYIESNFNSLSTQEVADNAQSIKSLGLENKLTASQLENNLDVFDLSKLIEQELSKAISQQYGSNFQINNLPSGSKIENDVLKAEDNTINLNELKGTHAIEFEDGKLVVDNNEFKAAKGVGSDSTNNVKVKEVSNVKTKNNYDFSNIKDAVFAFDASNDLIAAQFSSSTEKNTFSKYDNNGNKIIDFEIIDTSKPSSIEIEKQQDNTYKIKTSNIKNIFYGVGYNEYVLGENSEFSVDPEHGIYFVNLDSPGIYRCESINSDQSFAIQRGNGLSRYSLTIDKPNHREDFLQFKLKNDNNPDAGYVSQFEKKVYLNGIVNYLKFNDADNSFYTAYEGMDDNNKAEMNLDNDFAYIEDLFIKNENPANTGIISFLTNGKYAVYENYDGEKVKRFGRFSEEIVPVYIKNYNSDFGSYNYIENRNNPLVSFEDGIMVQEGQNTQGTVTKVKAVCKDCEQKEEFEREMQERSEHYKIREGICT